MTNDKPTRLKATMLVGDFCRFHNCGKMTEVVNVEGTFRVCEEQGHCRALKGGCSVCGDYSDFDSLVIHHKNGDGDELEGKHRSGFHHKIVKGSRKIDDLAVLCPKCHNDGFVLRYLDEPFLSRRIVSCFDYHNQVFQRIGFESASFLCFDQRWQGTTLCLFRKQPLTTKLDNGYLYCHSSEINFILKIINGKVRFC